MRTTFPKTHLCFIKPQNLKVLRILNISVAFYRLSATWATFKKSQILFRKTLIFFWKLQVRNAWRGVTTSVSFYCELATFSDFGIIPKSFSENQFVFTKQPKTWTFWDILLFQSHSTSNLLLLELSRNGKINFEKPIYFLWEKKQTLNVLRKLSFFAAFYVKLANFSDF